jgi:hypothetical protein
MSVEKSSIVSRIRGHILVSYTGLDVASRVRLRIHGRRSFTLFGDKAGFTDLQLSPAGGRLAFDQSLYGSDTQHLYLAQTIDDDPGSSEIDDRRCSSKRLEEGTTRGK